MSESSGCFKALQAALKVKKPQYILLKLKCFEGTKSFFEISRRTCTQLLHNRNNNLFPLLLMYVVVDFASKTKFSISHKLLIIRY